MRKLASRLWIIGFAIGFIACSGGGGGSGGQSNGNDSGEPDKPGLAVACSDAQKIAGLCLYTLDLTNNPELNRCIQDYAQEETRGWHLVSQMETLVCPPGEYDIESLAGIEQLEALQVLNMNGSEQNPGKLTNVDALSGLTGLRELHLNYHDLEVIPELQSLYSLTHLALAHNGITDATPLAAYTELTQVDLSGNNLQTLGPIASLPNLAEVNLSDNSALDCDAFNQASDLPANLIKPGHCGCLLGAAELDNCEI